MASRFIAPLFDTGNGISPSDGAKLTFFITGTSTLKDTFSDEAATTPNTNPVVSDGDGLFPEIWITGAYKVTLTDKNNVPKWEEDPVRETSDLPDLANDTDLSKGVALVGRAVQTFDSVAQMVTAPLTAGQIAYTQSYVSGWAATVRGPLGGTTYNIVSKSQHDIVRARSTVDEALDHTLSSGLVALYRFQGSIDITEAGAVLDGVHDSFTGTDDTDAWQAVFSFLSGTESVIQTNQMGVGGEVTMPAGISLVDQLALGFSTFNQNISLRGQGPIASVVKTTNITGGDILTVTGTSGDSIHGMAIRDMSFEGNSLCGVGLNFDRVIRQCMLERVSVHNTGSHGVHIHSISNLWTLKDCRIYRDNDAEYTGLTGSGVHCEAQGEQVYLYGCSIRGWEHGLDIGSFVNGVNIHGGDIHGNVTGLHVQGSSASDGHASAIYVSGIYFENNGIDVDAHGAAAPGGPSHTVTIAPSCSFSNTQGTDEAYGNGVKITTPSVTASVSIRNTTNFLLQSNEFRKITSANVDHVIFVSSQAVNIQIDRQDYDASVTISSLMSVDSGATNVTGFIAPDTDPNWDQQNRPVTIQSLAYGASIAQEISAGKLDMSESNIILMEAESGSADDLDFLAEPVEAGKVIILKPKVGEPTITVTDNTGSAPAGYSAMQIGGDFAMDPNDTLTLYYDMTDGLWIELARSVN